VCPHYTCECLLYLSLAVVAAPEGKILNQTVMSALLFVVLNLGATAHGTRRWYVGKFGATSVASRWTMIPVLY
jgi:3-oxo-5-alpha-steroid 4-dehydrogenase 3